MPVFLFCFVAFVITVGVLLLSNWIENVSRVAFADSLLSASFRCFANPYTGIVAVRVPLLCSPFVLFSRNCFVNYSMCVCCTYAPEVDAPIVFSSSMIHSRCRNFSSTWFVGFYPYSWFKLHWTQSWLFSIVVLD